MLLQPSRDTRHAPVLKDIDNRTALQVDDHRAVAPRSPLAPIVYANDPDRGVAMSARGIPLQLPQDRVVADRHPEPSHQALAGSAACAMAEQADNLRDPPCPARIIPSLTKLDSRDSQTATNLNRWRKREVCDGFSDFFADRLRRARLRLLARQAKDANQARRLLALASIYDGGSRSDAARLGSVTLQIVRDWVVRFNARGPDGLINGKAPALASHVDN
ncbi:hypothetical protein ACVMB2_003524 [Sinorhizobium meliloti]